MKKSDPVDGLEALGYALRELDKTMVWVNR
jgi:hypothetical protein